MAHNGVTIYALSTKSDPDNYRYVGQYSPTNPHRLKQHIRDAIIHKGTNPKKEQWIREALANGDDIISTTMREVPINEWCDAENEVMTDLRCKGHDLFNKINGTIVGFFEDDFESTEPVLPTVDQFLSLEWSQSYTQKKKGEWKTTFHDATLTRTNWRVCVIKTSNYERVAGVKGYGVDGDKQVLAQSVVDKMSIQPKVTADQQAQTDRLRPKIYE